MKKNKYYLHALLFGIMVLNIISCDNLDLYTEPGETLVGTITDKNTGDLIETDQPNGIRIKLEEISWSETPEPLYFWVKPDGTFQNTKVFKGRYVVTPVDGPFFPITGDTVQIQGKTEVNFKVEPFLKVKIDNTVQNGGNMDVYFKISRDTPAYKITDAKIFISTTKFVGNNSFLSNMSGQILSPSINFNGSPAVPDETVLANTHKLSVIGLKGGNRTYYLRVGARTNDNIQKRYNYSEIIKIVVP